MVSTAASDELPQGVGASGEAIVDTGASEVLGGGRLAALLVGTVAAGLCSIVYELLIGTASSYFLGDSVTQFSLTIGLFMAAMGLGSFLTRYLGDVAPVPALILVELLLSLLGGTCVPLLWAIYGATDALGLSRLALILIVGGLTGLEIPLLALVLRRHYPLEVSLSNILSLDYLGALGATFLFPFVLLPFLGPFRASLVVGLVNLGAAVMLLMAFRGSLQQALVKRLALLGAFAGVVLVALMAGAAPLLKFWYGRVYPDHVVLVKHSSYQEIVVTRYRQDYRLYLNGNLQFSTVDEHRYHESLVHPAVSLSERGERVLMLGGGDGLGLREVLKHQRVREVTLVDLDPAMTQLARSAPLARLNDRSLDDARVKVVHQDAFVYVSKARDPWDVIIVDLPDPNDTSLARLYSREFYAHLSRVVAKGGMLVTQATSPYYSRRAFWCIDETLQAAGLKTRAYHAYVPAFGDWGFILAGHVAPPVDALRVDVPTRFLTPEILPQLFAFDKDTARIPSEPSTIEGARVLSFYLADWRKWQ